MSSAVPEIRQLSVEDLASAAAVMANAYPLVSNLATAEARAETLARLTKFQTECPNGRFFGLYRDGVIAGSMRIYDFQMRAHSTMIPVTGIGSVAVDLLHKKEKVARDLVKYYLEAGKRQGAVMAALYPFRQDFYARMGFGVGTRMHALRIKPDAIPGTGDKTGVRFLTLTDVDAIVEMFNGKARETHGMMETSSFYVKPWFDSGDTRHVGFAQDGRLNGIMSFTFKPSEPGNFLRQDLVVSRLIHRSPVALFGFLSFLRSQADQVDRIHVNTQDEDLWMLFEDPRDGSNGLIEPLHHQIGRLGAGMMYRILDAGALFLKLSEHNFNGANLRLRLVVDDDFLASDPEVVNLAVVDGKCSLSSGVPEAEVKLSVGALSSLVMGAVRFRALLHMGMAQISDAQHTEAVDRAFAVTQRPVCMTIF